MKAGSFENAYRGVLRAAALAGAALLLIGGAGVSFATDGGSSPPPRAQCDDQLDNDGDNLIDYPEDPDCTSAADASEAPEGARAAGGGEAGAGETETYYQRVVGKQSAAELANAAPELPSALFIEEADATATYERLGDGHWELRIDGFHRNHERVDAIYDMILLLALPAAPDGGDAFTTPERGVRVEEGPAERSVPLVYGGEKIVLKRNAGIEKGLLARLTGSGPGRLPSLEGSGQRWTAWDTIVSRDASFGDFVQARAVLRYEAAGGAAAPDAQDPRIAAYLITWIPSLPASVPPYAVRIGVQGPPD